MTVEIREKLVKLWNSSPFACLNNIRLAELEDDFVVAELVVEHNALNPLGTAHGGVLYSIADCAAGFAAMTDGRIHVTLSGNLAFLQSGKQGDVLRAESRISLRNRRTSHADVKITNQAGELLGKGSFIFYQARPASAAGI